MGGYDHDNIRALLALLDPGRFETLCHELLGAEGHTDRHHRGAGGGDRGIDILSTGPDGRRWATQCKRSQSGPSAKGKILEDLESALREPPTPLPAVYLVATNTAVTPPTVDALNGMVATATFPLELALWDGTEIVSLLMKHTGILHQYLPISREPDGRHGILPPARDFTGRETELANLLAAVDAKPAALIAGLQGMGGIGKTELARRIAQERWDDFPDAHLEIDLLGASAEPLPSTSALAQVVRYLKPQAQLPDDESSLRAIFQTTLRGKSGVLLLDNAASAEQVQPLLPPSGWLTLVTSRFHFVVPGLEVLDLGPMPEEEARSFLAELSPRAVDVADDVLCLTGRLPLALRLAGSALAMRTNLTPAAYVRRLEKISGLEGGVARTLGVSFDLFDADQQTRWSALGVFPGSFTAAAVAAVWEMNEHDAEDALSEYIASSMVTFGDGRYRLHDLARVFARAHPIELDTIHYRHAAFYVAALAGFDDRYLKGNEGVLEGLRGFDLERRNIEAARAWLCQPSRDEAARRLLVESVNAGVYVLDLRLHPSDWIAWQEQALRAARSLEDKAAEGRLLGNLGLAYGALGDTRKAVELYDQDLAIAREIGDRRNEGSALGSLGLAYGTLGDSPRAIKYYEQWIVIAREIGDRRGEGQALGNLGLAYGALGDSPKAIDYHEQYLAIAREIGDRRGEGQALGCLGLAYEALGDSRRAIGFYEQWFVIAREMDDRRGEGQALGNLGVAYKNLGDSRRAIEHHEQHLAIARETGDRLGAGNALGNLGNVYSVLGDSRKAIEHYKHQLAITREIGDRRGKAIGSWNMAENLEKLGDLERAIDLGQVRVDFEREIGHPDAEKHAALVEGWRERLLSGD